MIGSFNIIGCAKSNRGTESKVKAVRNDQAWYFLSHDKNLSSKTMNKYFLELEPKICKNLRDLIASRPTGSNLTDEAGASSLRDLMKGCEFFLPTFMHEHFDWQESLDGFSLLSAEKSGLYGATFFGLSLLITSQTWTPFQLAISLFPEGEQIHWIDFKIGEVVNGRFQHITYELSNYFPRTEEQLRDHSFRWMEQQLDLLDSRADSIQWFHELKGYRDEWINGLSC